MMISGTIDVDGIIGKAGACSRAPEPLPIESEQADELAQTMSRFKAQCFTVYNNRHQFFFVNSCHPVDWTNRHLFQDLFLHIVNDQLNHDFILAMITMTDDYLYTHGNRFI